MSWGGTSDRRTPGTADLLNYAALIDDGLVLCKDGSLLAGFFFRGPDQESATPEERQIAPLTSGPVLPRPAAETSSRSLPAARMRPRRARPPDRSTNPDRRIAPRSSSRAMQPG